MTSVTLIRRWRWRWSWQWSSSQVAHLPNRLRITNVDKRSTLDFRRRRHLPSPGLSIRSPRGQTSHGDEKTPTPGPVGGSKYSRSVVIPSPPPQRSADPVKPDASVTAASWHITTAINMHEHTDRYKGKRTETPTKRERMLAAVRQIRPLMLSTTEKIRDDSAAYWLTASTRYPRPPTVNQSQSQPC